MQSINPQPMKLVAITAPGKINFETDTINRLFGEGLDELHIHKPQYDKATMEAFIQKIDIEFHSRLVLHSHYSLIHSFDITRIHLGRRWKVNFFTNLYLERVILKGKKVHKSKTVSSCEEVYHSIYGLDELVLGPVFGKTMYYVDKQEIKTDQMEKALKHSKIPVTAMGGIYSNTLGFFENIGFKSVALQSAIWKTIDPVRAFVEIKNQCQYQRTIAA